MPKRLFGLFLGLYLGLFALIVSARSAPAASEQDPLKAEGEIIQVDTPQSEILVREIDGREKRALLKQGMIGQYKVGDYVAIGLMADQREAKTIKTRRTADIDGEVVQVDPANNRIVIRDSGAANWNVVVQPANVTDHRVGDRVRLYVLYDDSKPTFVHLIRVQ